MSGLRKIATFAVVAFCIGLLASPAAAENDTTKLEAGSNVLVIGLTAPGSNWGGNIGTGPMSVGNIGFFHNFTHRFQFGGALGFGYADDLAFEASPTAKIFLTVQQRVNPYGYAHFDLAYDTNDFDVGLGGGFGAEFFAVPEFSIGGRAGVLLIESAGGADIITMVSGIDLNFYF